jgi:hypothetical protein
MAKTTNVIKGPNIGGRKADYISFMFDFAGYMLTQNDPPYIHHSKLLRQLKFTNSLALKGIEQLVGEAHHLHTFHRPEHKRSYAHSALYRFDPFSLPCAYELGYSCGHEYRN